MFLVIGDNYLTKPHQEIDIVVTGNNGTYPHLCYFYADTTTGKSENSCAYPRLPFDATATFHTYRLEWSAERLVFSIDGVEYRRVTERIPSIPGYIKLILRPGDSPVDHAFQGPAALGLRWLRYTAARQAG